MDIGQITRVVLDIAGIINAAYKTQGFIFNAVEFFGPVNDLRGVNFAAFKAEIPNLSPDAIAALELQFNNALQLPPAAMEKIAGGESLLNQAIAMIPQVSAFVQTAQDLETQGMALVNQVKSFAGGL